MRITVKDSCFRVLGYIEDTGGGDKTITDSSFKVIGYYKRSTDTVTDAQYRVVAYGDAPGILFNK